MQAWVLAVDLSEEAIQPGLPAQYPSDGRAQCRSGGRLSEAAVVAAAVAAAAAAPFTIDLEAASA